MIQKSIIQHNRLTNSKNKYSVTEKRILYHIILHLQKKNYKEETLQDLIDNQHITITIRPDQLKITDVNDHWARDYEKASIALLTRVNKIQTDRGGWKVYTYINHAEFDKKTGLTLEVSKYLLPDIIGLSNNFTTLSTITALSLNNRFTQRFYELCCQYNNQKSMWFEKTPEELNELFQFTKPQKTGWLKQNVINKAQEELKTLYDKNECELYFTYEEEREKKGQGRTIKKWRFNIHSNKEKKEPVKTEINLNQNLAYIANFLLKAWGKKNPEKHEKVLAQIHELNIIDQVAERFQKINARKVDNLGAYITTLLRAEFNINI